MYYEKYLNNLCASSGWASDGAFAASPGCVCGQWGRPHEDGGVVLANHDGRVVVDGGGECRHVLVIGATGTGKSRLIIMPSLLYSLAAKNRRSYVVFDVKGELEAETADAARRGGYALHRIDFRTPDHGDGWNPFCKIDRLYHQGEKGRGEAWRLLEDMIAAIFQDGGSTKTDPFWKTISASLFRGICFSIWENDEPLSLARILNLSRGIPADRDDDGECPLFRMADSLAPDSVARRNLQGFRNGSIATRGNVIATFNTYLSHIIARDDILNMMSTRRSLDFWQIGLTPTVLYISLPDDSTALGSLQSMLLTQLQQDLNECALTHGGVLPVRTDVYLDEFCNIHPAIPSFETALTISRSRGIRYVLAVQSYSQLAGVYGQAAETIAANCSTWIALNISKDETFRAKLSQLCGTNALGTPLITPSQLALLRYEEGIVIRERLEPYFARLEDLSSVKERIKRPDKAYERKGFRVGR